MKRIGVNGFGRIGRYFTHLSLLDNEVDVAVVNDLADINTLAHLFKYDSIHRFPDHRFVVEGNALRFPNGKRIEFISEADPSAISWSKYGASIVLESTGVFRTEELAREHLKGGAEKVLMSAPPKEGNVPTIVLGVNDEKFTFPIDLISNASCTTNSAAPMLKVMQGLGTINSAYITTVHSYTSDQRLQDSPHEDLRRARSAPQNIIPTTTGAAKALSKIFPEFEGKLGGCGIRVPVPDGSLTDLTLIMDNPPSVKEINREMYRAANNELKGILRYTEDPIVSSDIIGDSHSSIFDAQLTSVVGNMVKIMGWYDNESGYSNRLIDLVKKM